MVLWPTGVSVDLLEIVALEGERSVRNGLWDDVGEGSQGEGQRGETHVPKEGAPSAILR